MSERPSRAKMCNWLSARLSAAAVIVPSNPADVRLLSQNARQAEKRIRELASIAAELGWHADAELDKAWQLIRDYDARAALSTIERSGGDA